MGAKTIACGLGLCVNVGVAAAIININQHQLYHQDKWCNSYTGTWQDECYEVGTSCYFATDPWYNMKPCEHLYVFSALALVMQVGVLFAVCYGIPEWLWFQASAKFVCWVVAGSLFTVQFIQVKDAVYKGSPIPAGSYRLDVLGVIWGACSMAVIELVVLSVLTVRSKPSYKGGSGRNLMDVGPGWFEEGFGGGGDGGGGDGGGGDGGE